MIVIQFEVLDRQALAGGRPISKGLLLLLRLDLLRLFDLMPLVQEGQHKMAMMMSVRKIPKSNVRKIPAVMMLRKIPAVSTHRPCPSPGGRQTTPSSCSRLGQQKWLLNLIRWGWVSFGLNYFTVYPRMTDLFLLHR